jgi:hypothetical protein
MAATNTKKDRLHPRTYRTVGRNVGMSLPVVQVDYVLPCRQTERERERERERGVMDIEGLSTAHVLNI